MLAHDDTNLERYEDAKTSLLRTRSSDSPLKFNFSSRRKCADRVCNLIIFLLVLCVITGLVILLYLPPPAQEPLSKLKEFQRYNNNTYCEPNRGWTRASNCKECDTTRFNYTVGLSHDDNCILCLPTRWGPHCNFTCPGTTAAGNGSVPCNGHGTCDSGLFGSGQCYCIAFYRGALNQDCENNGIIKMIVVLIFIVMLVFVALKGRNFHTTLFYQFFNTSCCPTIFVELELALSETPLRSNGRYYFLLYVGMFLLTIIPQLCQNTQAAITPPPGNSDNVFSPILLYIAQTISVWSCIILMCISLWKIIAAVLTLASKKGKEAALLRLSRNRLSKDFKILRHAWIIQEEEIDLGEYVEKKITKRNLFSIFSSCLSSCFFFFSALSSPFLVLNVI